MFGNRGISSMAGVIVSGLLTLALAAQSEGQAYTVTSQSTTPKTIAKILTTDGHHVGSGTVISRWGNSYVLSCAHVVGGEGSVIVSVDGSRHLGNVIAIDTGRDLCLIEIPKRNRIRSLGNSISTTERLYLCGYGNGVFQCRYGRFQGFGRKTDSGTEAVVISGRVYGGDSGGPILNEQGRIVGVIAVRTDGGQAITMGPSYSEISRFLDSCCPRPKQPTPTPPPVVYRPQPQQPPATQPQQPWEPQPTPAQTVDYDRIAREVLAQIPAPQPGADGRPGRDGKDGKDGQDGNPGCQGPAGPSGKDADPAQVAEALKPFIQSELTAIKAGLSQHIDERLASLGQSSTSTPTVDQQPETQPDSEPITQPDYLVYVTARNLPQCRASDQAIEQIQSSYPKIPITTVWVNRQDVLVNDVPALYVSRDRRSIVGAESIREFLAQLAR